MKEKNEQRPIQQVTIGDECLQSYPCQHKLSIKYEDGGTKEFYMDGVSILEKYKDYFTPNDKKHFAQYEADLRMKSRYIDIGELFSRLSRNGNDNDMPLPLPKLNTSKHQLPDKASPQEQEKSLSLPKLGASKRESPEKIKPPEQDKSVSLPKLGANKHESPEKTSSQKKPLVSDSPHISRCYDIKSGLIQLKSSDNLTPEEPTFTPGSRLKKN